MTLKRMVPFVVLGLIWLAAPAGAEAQLCSELCVENVDEDGKFKGFGCTNDGDTWTIAKRQQRRVL